MSIIPMEGPAEEGLLEAAQKLYPKKAGITELHHIEPMYIGGAKSGALVPLDAAYHQMITNEFRNLYPYGQGPILHQILKDQIMNDVYTKFPLPPGYWPK